MPTALDAPQDRLDQHEREFVDIVREHGWHEMRVFDETGAHPDFNYSTGIWHGIGFPEIILFSMKRDTARKILWDVYRSAKSGNPPLVGIPTDDIFGNAKAILLPVAKRFYAEYLGWSSWFYGNDAFPCLHLIWPDRSGAFPWEPAYDAEFRDLQPDLTETGWEAAVANATS